MKKAVFILLLYTTIDCLGANDTEIAIFSYTGTGDTMWVTDANLTFSANAIMVFSIEDSACLWTSTMGANATSVLACDYGTRSGLIISVTDDSFQVSEDEIVNKNAATYYVVAIKTDDVISKVGSWTGNGVDNRWINIGIDVDFLLVKNDYLANTLWKISEITGDSTVFMAGGPAFVNYIQAMSADSIQLGNSGYVNGSGHTYWYLALTNIDSLIFVGKAPAGNQADDRDIDLGWSYTPDFALVNSSTYDTKSALRINEGGETTASVLGCVSYEALEALISGGYTVSYDVTCGHYLNNNSRYDWSLLLNEGSSITSDTKPQSIVIYD
ncbi:MAG: hypothetical protein ACFE95_02810 [Candidatus Hodarchaeota archaeon]